LGQTGKKKKHSKVVTENSQKVKKKDVGKRGMWS